MIALGIDCGSTTTKGALYDGNQIVRTLLLPTSARPAQRMQEVYDALYTSDVACTVTTGYGRELLPQADRTITEITCHAKGASLLGEDIRCVIDIGGQDCKAILLDPSGAVVDFAMNDKCAAGTGRFIEMMTRILDFPIDEIDRFTEGHTPCEISSMCTVFAESEIISLLAADADRGDIALGVIESICRRTAAFALRLSPTGTAFFTGGLAQFEIFRRTIEKGLGLKVVTHPLAQFAGAIGAAVFGYTTAQSRRR